MSKDEKKSKNDVKNGGKFWKESKAELKKVSWPKPKSLVNDTVTVIVIVLVVAIVVAVLDFAFYWLNQKVVVEPEEKIMNSRSVDDVTNTTEVVENIENPEDTSTNTSDQTTENEEVTESNEAE